MMRELLIVAGVCCLAGCTSERGAPSAPQGARQSEQSTAPDVQAEAPSADAPQAQDAPDAPDADERYVLGVSMNRIDGHAEPLEAYRGKVVLVVNVASACGLTPQYEGLQALYESKGDEGLVVLGFPANNFGNQEPGTNKEIEEFCTGRYDVTFPMFEKISVTGDDQHPLYQRLSQEGGAPTWNFTKYLVDRRGRVVARFDPRTRPDDAGLLARIDELLAE